MPTTVAPRGKTITVNVGKQTADFKTAAANDYVTTFILSHSLVAKQPFADDPTLGTTRTNDRDPNAPAPGLRNGAGNIVVPLDWNHIGVWLNAAFGSATDTGSADPWQHVFTSGGEALPWLTTEVEVKTPGGNEFLQYIGIVVSKWSIEASRAAGFGKMTFETMFRDEVLNSSTGAGTPAAPYVRQPIPDAIGTFAMNGSTLADVLKFSATYDNKVKALEALGDPAGLISGVDLDGETAFTGSLQLRFRSVALYNQAVAASSFEGTLSYASGSNRLLQFDAPLMYIERAGVEITGPAGIEQTFNFRCAQDASHPMLTTTLKNAVASHNA